MKPFLIAVALLSSGCSLLVARPPASAPASATPERCESLSDRATVYTTLGAGFALAGGGAGLSSVAVDSRDLRTGLALGAVVSAAAAAAFGAGASATSAAFVRDGCGR